MTIQKKEIETLKQVKNLPATNLIPYQDEYYECFTIKGNTVIRQNKKIVMLSFKTTRVNQKKYEFRVESVRRSDFYQVGIIAEKNANQTKLDGLQRIFYSNFGYIQKDDTAPKSKLFENYQYCYEYGSVRLLVDQIQGSLIIEAESNKGEKKVVKQALSNFKADELLVPYINFNEGVDAELIVTLK